jgi:hypothetical protein
MPRNRYPARLAVAVALPLLLSACDRMRSTEPPPSYESPTVGAAREIAGSPAAPAATPPNAAASAK